MQQVNFDERGLIIPSPQPPSPIGPRSHENDILDARKSMDGLAAVYIADQERRIQRQREKIDRLRAFGRYEIAAEAQSALHHMEAILARMRGPDDAAHMDDVVRDCPL